MAAVENPRCPTCRYELRGLLRTDPMVCPECGSTHSLNDLRHPVRWRFLPKFLLLGLSPSVLLAAITIIGLRSATRSNNEWLNTLIYGLLAASIAIVFYSAFQLVCGSRPRGVRVIRRSIIALPIAALLWVGIWIRSYRFPAPLFRLANQDTDGATEARPPFCSANQSVVSFHWRLACVASPQQWLHCLPTKIRYGLSASFPRVV